MSGNPWGFQFAGNLPKFSIRPPLGRDGRPLGRRFELSPNLAKGERGGVLPPPISVKFGGKAAVEIEKSGPVDDARIKLALLFVDRIDVPDNSNLSQGMPSLEPLQRMGIGARSKVYFEGGIEMPKLFEYPWITYLELEKREAGRWSIWQEPNQQIVPEDQLSPDLAFRLELTSGLIVPDALTPFDEVLYFKERHRDELISLRHHLEDFAIKLSKEGDPRAVNLERERFDISLAEYLKKARQSNVKRAVASLTTELDWAAAVRSAIGGGGGGIFAATQGLSLTAAAAAIGGGVLAGLSVKSVPGLKKGPYPFRYIARVEKEYGG